MKKSVLCLIAVMFVSACTTVRTNMFVAEAYPPTDPAKVQIFASQKPDRDYIEIGELEIRGRSFEKVRQKAAAVGADGIIMSGSRREIKATTDIIWTKTIRRAIAIKFKN